MCDRLSAANNPSLILMNYDPVRLSVTNLFFVPKHFFVREIIQERKPLAATARRAGWVGCNILLSEIPEAGKIFLVRDGQQSPKSQTCSNNGARRAFLRARRALRRGARLIRGNEMRRLLIGRRDFTLAEVYAQAPRLKALYPGNQNVRPKIRQQLQVLRDQGYLEFLGRGRYRLRSTV